MQLEPGPVTVRMVFHPPDNRRRDLFNLSDNMKYYLDGVFKASGIDDWFIAHGELDIMRDEQHSRETARVEVEIENVKPET